MRLLIHQLSDTDTEQLRTIPRKSGQIPDGGASGEARRALLVSVLLNLFRFEQGVWVCIAVSVVLGEVKKGREFAGWVFL